MEKVVSFRPTKAIVNLDAIQSNIKSLKSYLKSETSIMAVVKADGYGHGDIEIARSALKAGADSLAVATPDEAIKLRQSGISSDILVMAPSPVAFARIAADLQITVSVSCDQWLKTALIEQESFIKPLKIHMKIDCGMGRTGLRDVKVLQAIDEITSQSNNVILDGVFMQFSCADDQDATRTNEQFEQFMKFVQLLRQKPRLVHVSNSAATFLYPQYALDAVRVGITMYGITSSEFVQKHIPFPLERSLSIESELSVVKLLEKGSTISYGATYKTIGDEWIGTIPMGYADGLQRNLSGQEVLINGERMPIVGAICMDQCMVKLTREMKEGERVVLIGKQGEEEITFEEWATRLNTISYEVVVSIGERIPRQYLYKG